MSTDGIKHVIVILDSVFLFLNYGRLEVVPKGAKVAVSDDSRLMDLHSLMVDFPGLTKDFTLFFELVLEIVAKISQSVLELFLEGVENVVHVAHGFHCLLFVLLNLPIRGKVMLAS